MYIFHAQLGLKPISEINSEIKIKKKKPKNISFHLLNIQIWYILQKENGSVQLDLAADLARHQRAVNAVRWSPSGEFLASGDDESIIFIWKLKSENEPINVLGKKYSFYLIFEMLLIAICNSLVYLFQMIIMNRTKKLGKFIKH